MNQPVELIGVKVDETAQAEALAAQVRASRRGYGPTNDPLASGVAVSREQTALRAGGTAGITLSEAIALHKSFFLC